MLRLEGSTSAAVEGDVSSIGGLLGCECEGVGDA